MASTYESKNRIRMGDTLHERKQAPNLRGAVNAGRVIKYPARDHGEPISSHRNEITIQTGRSKTFTTRSTDQDAQEQRIVKKVLQGESADFQILVRRYHKPIYHFMYRVLRNVMTAEDLTQETFTRAYEKLSTFNAKKRFFPWLYAIAINLTKDHLRRQGIADNLFLDDDGPERWPDPNGEDCAKKPDCVLEVGQVTLALEKLPLGYSEPMLLFYREGFSVKEISNVLGISSAAVKVRLHRGRKKLMHKLGAGYEKS